MTMLFYFLASISFIIGGFVLYFRETDKIISYFSIGFIMLGVQSMFSGISFPNDFVQFVFKLPLFISSILFLIGTMEFFMKGGKRRKK